MNIKQHIEAGHYEKDHKGRPLVPIQGGDLFASILATDGDSHYPICGRIAGCADAETWTEEGLHLQGRNCRSDLLPPSPRKVKVKRWAAIAKDGDWYNSGPTRDSLKPDEQRGYTIVEMAGEYEEEWK